MKPSFNNLHPKLPVSVPESAPRDRSRRKKDRIRHGDHYLNLSPLPGGQPRWTVEPVRRTSRLLAPVLRQGVRSLPAGVALHARPGPGLSRQADDVIAPSFRLITSAWSYGIVEPRRPGGPQAFLIPLRYPGFDTRTLARRRIARDHRASRDGRIFAPSSSP